MRVITKGDVIIITATVLLSFVFYLIFSFAVFAESPQKAEVFVDGKIYASYNLTEIKDKKVVEIKTKYGKNTLELAKDGVRVLDATCPDKNDVKSGKITKSNQMIICIPNRFFVKLSDGIKKVDRVTY